MARERGGNPNARGMERQVYQKSVQKSLLFRSKVVGFLSLSVTFLSLSVAIPSGLRDFGTSGLRDFGTSTSGLGIHVCNMTQRVTMLGIHTCMLP